MITLEDAIERAKLAADDSGHLGQSFYNMLVNQVDETEIYPLTMALSEVGIMVRTGSAVVEEDPFEMEAESGAEVKPAKFPVNFSNSVTLEKKKTGPAKKVRSKFLRFLRRGQELESTEDVSDIRSVLESTGISVSSDGMVSMYTSNIPEIYTDRLPQAFPLDVAVQLWEQRLEIADNEQGRVKALQDAIARLRVQVKERAETGTTPRISEIEASLRELEDYGFNLVSTSEISQSIATLIENIFEMVMSSNWTGAISTIDDAQITLEEYAAQQNSDYEVGMFVWDALDRLQNLQYSNPDAFDAATSNLGGLAARLVEAQAIYSDYGDADLSPSYVLALNLNWDEFSEFVANKATVFGIRNVQIAVEDVLGNESDWISGAVQESIDEVLGDYVADIEVSFSENPTDGYFVDQYGGDVDKALDDSEINGVVDIFERHITQTLEEGSEFFDEE
jgi:hypothetical protein